MTNVPYAIAAALFIMGLLLLSPASALAAKAQNLNDGQLDGTYLEDIQNKNRGESTLNSRYRSDLDSKKTFTQSPKRPLRYTNPNNPAIPKPTLFRKP